MKKFYYKTIIFFVIFCCKVNYVLAADFAVAKINNKIITDSELADRYKFVLFVSKITIKSKAEEKILLDQVLSKMIDEELIRQDAAKLKIEVSSEELRDSIDLIAVQQKKNATQFKISMIQKGLSFENYMRQVEAEVMWSKIISDVLRSRVKITEAETREFFEQQHFDTNVKKFHIAEIFIPKSPNAASLASKLVMELKSGADFKNIVKQFSQSLSVENSGDLGWVLHNEIDPKIYNELSKLNKNEYSNPILLADGYFIFKLLDAKVESKVADKDLNAAKNAIFSRKLQIIAKGYLNELHKNAFVEEVR